MWRSKVRHYGNTLHSVVCIVLLGKSVNLKLEYKKMVRLTNDKDVNWLFGQLADIFIVITENYA